MAENPNAKQIAEDFAGKVYTELIATKIFSESDIRLTAFTFGDMKIQNVWQFYYEEPIYKRLIKIKAQVDPKNVFRTDFTIPVRFDEDDEGVNEEDSSSNFILFFTVLASSVIVLMVWCT